MGSAAAAAAFDISEFLSQRAEFEECDGDGSGGLSLLEFKCVQAAAALLFVPALLMLLWRCRCMGLQAGLQFDSDSFAGQSLVLLLLLLLS